MPGRSSARLLGPLAPAAGLAAGWLAAFHARIAFLAIAAAGVGVMVLVGTQGLLLGLVASQPWADMLHYPTATFTIPKILGLLLVGSWLLRAVTQQGQELRFAPPIGWAFAFIATVVLSLMLSPDPSAGTQKTISYLLYAVFAALFVQLVRGRAGVERTLRVYAAAAAAAAAYGLVHFLNGALGRAGGPISDPNDFAFVLASALPMLVYFARRSPRHRVPWALGALVVTAATAATLSRGALVGLLALLVWALLTGRISLPNAATGVAAFVVVALAAVWLYGPLIHERLVSKQYIADKNVSSRQVFWSAAGRMALDRPLTGVGPGRFGAESTRYVLNDPIVLHNPVVHNTYLEILAENGALALALFLGLLISSWRQLARAAATASRIGDTATRQLAVTLQASFVVAVVSCTFVSEELAIPLWLIAGLAGSLVLATRERADVAGEPGGVVLPLPAA